MITREKNWWKKHWKLHYIETILCKETDVIYRECYTCKKVKPLDNEHFVRNSYEKMWFMFQCKDCRNEYKNKRNEILRAQKEEKHEQLDSKDFKAESLFKESSKEKDTFTLSDVRKILSYFWIKKWQ